MSTNALSLAVLRIFQPKNVTLFRPTTPFPSGGGQLVPIYLQLTSFLDTHIQSEIVYLCREAYNAARDRLFGRLATRVRHYKPSNMSMLSGSPVDPPQRLFLGLSLVK